MFKNIDKNARKKSYLVALFFVVIAVFGIWLKFSTPDSKPAPERQKSEETMVQDTTENNREVQLQSDSTGFANYSRSRDSYSGGIIKTIIIAVLFILFITIGLLMFKKKFTSSRTFGMDMEILGKKYFGQKQFILMVRIEDEKLLLGVTDHSINLIKEFGEMSAEEKAQSEKNRNPQNAQSFPQIIKKISFNKD